VPPGAAKSIGFVRRKPVMPVDAFQRAKADDSNFLAPGPVSFIITTEYVIVG
jgi:hypothetical protein